MYYQHHKVNIQGRLNRNGVICRRAAHEAFGASKCLLSKVKLMLKYFHLQMS